MTSPVIQADSSDARNTASGAIIRDATEPAERRLPSDSGAGATLKGPRGYIPFGFSMTGSDGADTDFARRQFERQSPGQRFDSAFRGSVQQGSRHRTRADNGADVDDASPVGPEPLDWLLHGENRPENVDVVVDVKTVFGDLGEGAEAEYPGVVKTSRLPNAECTSLNNCATSAALDTSAPTAIASPPLSMIA
jgi:hypothetical protein